MSKKYRIRILRRCGVSGTAHVEGQLLEVEAFDAISLVGCRAAEMVHASDMRRLVSESRANDARLERGMRDPGSPWLPMGSFR